MEKLVMLLILTFSFIFVNCDQKCKKDTSWNKKNVPDKLRSWMESFDKEGLQDCNMKGKQVSICQGVVITYHKLDDGNEAVEAVTRIDESTGKPQLYGWKIGGFSREMWPHHNGYLYGKMDEKGNLTGSDVVFVYPDFKNVLVGNFEHDVMIEAREAKIIAERCHKGLKQIRLSTPKPEVDRVYIFFKPNSLRITPEPTLMDPYEKSTVYIGEGVSGDGIFAKREIKSGELIVYYAGTRHATVFTPNMTDTEIWDTHKNLINFKRENAMNILKENWDISKYRASLGHKVNHSFTKFNSKFCYVHHPRFGQIRCLKATKDIAKGEEILCHYRYSTNYRLPDWYKREHIRETGTLIPTSSSKPNKNQGTCKK